MNQLRFKPGDLAIVIRTAPGSEHRLGTILHIDDYASLELKLIGGDYMISIWTTGESHDPRDGGRWGAMDANLAPYPPDPDWDDIELLTEWNPEKERDDEPEIEQA